MLRIYRPVIFAGLCFSYAACSENKFKSGAPSGATTPVAAESSLDSSSGGPPKPPSNAPGLASCAEGDKIVIPWTGPAKSCFDQGKTFSFETQTCLDLKKASFTCDWATLQAKLQAKSLLTDTLKNDAAAGAKLVNCSESADGNRIAVQWVKISQNPTLSCQNVQEGSGITTGCYTYYPNSNPPPPAQSTDEVRQRVSACLKDI